MKAGDKIRLFTYIMSKRQNDTRDLVVEEFRYCLGVFATKEARIAGRFTPLCNLYEPGPDSKQEYLSNYGEYHINMVQCWMNLS